MHNTTTTTNYFIVSVYYKHGETSVQFFNSDKDLFDALLKGISNTSVYFRENRSSNDLDFSMMTLYGREEFVDFSVDDFGTFSKEDLDWLIGAYLEIGDFIIQNQLGYGAKYVYSNGVFISN